MKLNNSLKKHSCFNINFNMILAQFVNIQLARSVTDMNSIC